MFFAKIICCFQSYFIAEKIENNIYVSKWLHFA